MPLKFLALTVIFSLCWATSFAFYQRQEQVQEYHFELPREASQQLAQQPRPLNPVLSLVADILPENLVNSIPSINIGLGDTKFPLLPALNQNIVARAVAQSQRTGETLDVNQRQYNFGLGRALNEPPKETSSY